MKQAVQSKFMVIIALQQFQAAFLTKNRAASAQPNVPTPHLWLQFWQAFHFHIPLMISSPYDVGMHACIYLAFFRNVQSCILVPLILKSKRIYAIIMHALRSLSTASPQISLLLFVACHIICIRFPSRVSRNFRNISIINICFRTSYSVIHEEMKMPLIHVLKCAKRPLMVLACMDPLVVETRYRHAAKKVRTYTSY